MIPEGNEHVESLNEVRITMKQPDDSLNNPWGINAVSGQKLVRDIFIIRQQQ